MFFHKFSRNLLLILFVVYGYIILTADVGNIVSQMSFIIIILISFIYFIKSFFGTKKKSLLYRSWTFFLILNIFGFFLTATYSEPLHYGMFLSLLMTFLPFYPFLYFSERGLVRKEHLIWFLIIMIPITIIGFYTNQKRIIEASLSGSQNVVNNVAYVFVRMMPFVFLIKRRISFSLFLMGLLTFFIIVSAKRGALLCAAIVLLFYTYYLLNVSSQKNKRRAYFYLFLAIPILGFLAFDFIKTNEFLVDRLISMAEGNSSERDVIFFKIIDSWIINGDLPTIFIGRGWAASLEITGGNFAHNDFLEIGSNFGLLGTVVYLILMYSPVKYSLSENLSFQHKSIMKVVVLVWFFISIFSMWYINQYGYLQSILIGFLLGNSSKFTNMVRANTDLV